MSAKKYYLVLDVETANSTDDALVYDLGYVVCDKKGTIYEADSFIVSDIFYKEAELMQSAYYAKKIPMYIEGIKSRAFNVVTFYEARAKLLDAMRRYKVEAVCAYNANFDYTALNTTQRWLTKSKYRFFLPYGTKVYCIWHMACQLICTQKAYIKFCLENGFVSPSGNIKTNAETVYAYMTKDSAYEENHTGLEDVLIETKILAKCFAQHKKVEKNINRFCWRIPQAKAKEIQAKEK
jgi:hypothetical protein